MAEMPGTRDVEGEFCPRCGHFYTTGAICPSCGEPAPRGTGSGLSAAINLSVLICSTCGHVMDIGAPSCPVCGEATSPSAPTDPREGPINRVKLKALGDLLPRFQRAAHVPPAKNEPNLSLTD